MKVCIIVDDYMPHSIKIAAKMMHELACELTAKGDQVSVITPNVDIDEKLVVEDLDGVNVYRFKSGKIKNVSKVKRAINETLLSYNAWKNCKDFFENNHHDLIIYYSPSIFFGPLVYKLKKLWNVKSYLILRDFFPQWAIDNKILSQNSPITYYFKFFEKVNYSVADTIGIMSPKNLEWFVQYYKTGKQLEVLYNWSDTKPFLCSDAKYRKKLNLEDKIVYFYGGNLGHAQDMLNLVRLAQKMKDEKRAHFVFVGTGDEYDLIEKAIEENKLFNITLLPSVNQDEFKQMLSEFDVGLFTLNKNHITHNFPGKLLGYMVEELAILGSINPNNDLKDTIEEYQAGYITINGEDDLLYENALKVLNTENRKNCTKNAKKLLQDKFSVESASKQILKIIEE